MIVVTFARHSIRNYHREKSFQDHHSRGGGQAVSAAARHQRGRRQLLRQGR
jgi:hypothetical protein